MYGLKPYLEINLSPHRSIIYLSGEISEMIFTEYQQRSRF